MRKCDECEYRGTAWLKTKTLEVFCPACRKLQTPRFWETLENRNLTYVEAIKLYDTYEERFIHYDRNTVTSWAELDVILNESISRKIRETSAKDKLA